MRVILHDLESVPAVLDGAPAPATCGSGDEALDQLTMAMTGPNVGATTLVLGPSWSPQAQRTMATARAATDLPRVMTATTSLPPGAAAVLGSLLVRLAGRILHEGALPLVVGLLERRLTSYALLDSVAGLERLQPSLGQHVTSWLPTSRFLATTSPTRAVERLGRKAQPQLAPTQVGGRTVLLGSDGPLLDELRHAAEQRRGDTSIQVAPSPAHTTQWWGTDGVVEGVDLPGDLDDLASWVHQQLPTMRECRWCQLVVPRGPCSFCGNLNDEAA